MKITLYFLITFLIIILSLFITACPNFIGPDTLNHVKDTISPVITIISPDDGSYYGSAIVVSGVATDQANDREGQISTLSYAVAATIIGGTVPVETDGSFSFHFACNEHSGPLVIRITATDWNGNQAQASITLLDKAEIHSFSVSPGNHKVLLSWEPVPFATSYTLYYTEDGKYPSQNYGCSIEGVESPYELEDLKNGTLYIFMLHAQVSAGEDNWSAYETVIPLSTFTLCPKVKGDYDRILVQWPEVPAIDSIEVEVWRSTTREGPFTNYSGPVTGNSFEDTEVIPGQIYYYKVKPSLDKCVQSEAGWAELSTVPTKEQTIIGSFNSGSEVMGLAIQGNIIYLPDIETGLYILDVSEPSQPSQLGKLELPGTLSVAVSGETAVVMGMNPVTSEYFLYTVDISDPSTPFVMATLSVDSIAFKTCIYEDTFFAAAISGFFHVDISNPYTPGDPETVSGIPNAWGILVHEPYAYVTDSNTLYVLDVTDPNAPLKLPAEIAIQDDGLGLAVSGDGDYLFVGQGFNLISFGPTWEGFQVYSIVDRENPAFVTEVYMPEEEVFDTVIDGNTMYLACLVRGLYAYDITDPANPQESGYWNTPAEAFQVVVQDDVIYIADGVSGLQVITNAAPRKPAIEGSFNTRGGGSADANDISLSGEFAFVIDGFTGLNILNVSNPAEPTLLTRYVRSGIEFTSVEVIGNYAFLGNEDGKLEILDVSQPSWPKVIGEPFLMEVFFESVGTIEDIIIRGDYAFLAVSSGIVVVDISDMEQLVLVSSYNTITSMTGAEHLTAFAHYLMAVYTGATGGMRIFDISNPVQPAIIGEYYGSAPVACSVGFSDAGIAYTYLAEELDGIRVLDLDDMSQPGSLVEEIFDPGAGSLCDVEAMGDYVYSAAGASGLQIFEFDPNNPATPTLLADCDTNGTSLKLQVRGRYAFIADYSSGLQIIDLMNRQ